MEHMDLNKVQIIGNVTQDPEVRRVPSGQSICSLTVATNRFWVDAQGVRQKSTEYHSVVLRGKLADIAETYVKKWKKIYIEGRLQTRSWESQDGVKRYKTEIIAENMILLSGPQEPSAMESNENSAFSFDQNWKQYSDQSWGAPVRKFWKKQEEEISIEDIPF